MTRPPAQPGYAPYGPPLARPRRRRWPWVLLTVLVVLVGLAVAADRVSLALAEDKAASTLQSSQHLSRTPDVSIDGFPFLTQLAAGKFGMVTISAHDVAIGSGSDLTLSGVQVRLDDVTVTNGYRTVTAGTARATGTISYAELSRVLNTPISYAGNDRIVAKPDATVAGQHFAATVSAGVRASSGSGLQFVDARVSASGVQLPSAVSQALAAVFAKAISLAGMPFGVTVAGASAGAGGVSLTLTGHDLTYSR